MENDSKQYYVKLPLWKKCTFGMIDSANNFSWSYISSFLAIYLTDTFLIPAATVSLMFLLCRFWDAINDPIVGYLADRTRSRWGRYRPWIMFASAPLFITTALLFWPHPEWAVGVKTAYVVILYALVVLFYTMVNLTYGSLNSVVTQDPAERGSLASWRLLFAYIGSTLMVQLVTRCEPVLSAKHPNMGYFILAVIFAVFCIPMQILCAKSQKEVVPPQPSPKKIGIFKSLAISFKNREFMIVCILFLAQGFALYGAGTINIYWFKYVLGDVKRGDIGSTAAAYAHHLSGVNAGEHAFDPWHEDAVTVNPYLGTDGITPFVEAATGADKDIFVLVRTSNPSSSELQELELASGERVYEHVADLVEGWGAETIGANGYSRVGAVVGATHPEEGKALRARMPHTFFLVPGYGAQGGTAQGVAGMFDKDGMGALVNSSRGIIGAWKKSGKYSESMSADDALDLVAESAREAAKDMRDNLRAVLP